MKIVFVCPDCGQTYEDTAPNKCANCACPSSLFVSHEYEEDIKEPASTKQTQTIKNITMITCPDCGKTWKNTAPDKCDNCGCPSNLFISEEHTIHNHIEVHRKEETSSSHSYGMFGVIFGVLVVGIITIMAIKTHNNKVEIERANYEQARVEERKRAEAEEEKRAAAEKKKIVSELCSSSWKQYHGDVYSDCLVEVLEFNKDGSGYINMFYYVGGNRMNSSYEKFNYEYQNGIIYVFGERTFYFDGTRLESIHGENYRKGRKGAFNPLFD